MHASLPPVIAATDSASGFDDSEFRRLYAALADANYRLADANQRLGLANERLAQADLRKDAFLAMMGHELRNPLAAIANALEIIRLRQRVNPDAELTWPRDVLDRQFAQLTRLVEDLLDTSRITRDHIELRREPLSLNDVVAFAVETNGPIFNARHQRLQVELTDPPLQVCGDAARLAQVFGNLLTNAAKYMHEGGSVRMSLRREAAQAVCTISDEGLGIPADKLETIFEPFTQLHDFHRAGGIGMGLPIVRKLVTLHDGSVRAMSAGEGQGSSFEVRLPLYFPA